MVITRFGMLHGSSWSSSSCGEGAYSRWGVKPPSLFQLLRHATVAVAAQSSGSKLPRHRLSCVKEPCARAIGCQTPLLCHGMTLHHSCAILVCVYTTELSVISGNASPETRFLRRLIPEFPWFYSETLYPWLFILHGPLTLRALFYRAVCPRSRPVSARWQVYQPAALETRWSNQ